MSGTDWRQIPRKIGILIPTRNRPDKVNKLLESLLQSSKKPAQVVVISSGSEISNIIDEFTKILPIKYLHSDVAGQVNQKKIGCKLIDDDIEWVIFLDDDLLIDSLCIETAIEAADSFERDLGVKVLGIGLALPATTRTTSGNTFTKLLGKIFGISNSNPGAVHKNGHAASYLHCNRVTTTQWLNGASMWKRELLQNYGLNLISTGYAACEDLLFSYPISHKGKLIFVPDAKVQFQDTELTNFEKFSIFESVALWRLFFVSITPGFSIPYFLFTQIGRNLFGTYKTNESRPKFIIRATALWFRLLYLSSSRVKIEKALRSL